MPCFPCFSTEEPCNGTWYLKVTSLLATGRNTCIPNKEALSFLRVRMKSNELTWVLKHPFRLNSPSVNKAHLACSAQALHWIHWKSRPVRNIICQSSASRSNASLGEAELDLRKHQEGRGSELLRVYFYILNVIIIFLRFVKNCQHYALLNW